MKNDKAISAWEIGYTRIIDQRDFIFFCERVVLYQNMHVQCKRLHWQKTI